MKELIEPMWVKASERMPKPNYRKPVKEFGGRYNTATYRKGNPQSERYWSENVEFWLDDLSALQGSKTKSKEVKPRSIDYLEMHLSPWFTEDELAIDSAVDKLFQQARKMHREEMEEYANQDGWVSCADVRKYLPALQKMIDRLDVIEELDPRIDDEEPIPEHYLLFFDVRNAKEAIKHLSNLSEPCTGNCGMNYCDENGCMERKRILTEPCDAPANQEGMESEITPVRIYRDVAMCQKVESILKPEYMNTVFTWVQVKHAILASPPTQKG